MKTQLKAAKKVQTKATRLIYERFRERFPKLPDEIEKVVYQYLPRAVRVRIIDDSFAGKTYMERELLIEDIFDELPEEVSSSISLLLLLTPREAKLPGEGMELEFDNPTGEHM